MYLMFIHFQTFVKNQFNLKIKAFNSDWGGEFRPLFTHFKNHGIFHRLACPHTHEQNEIAERKIWHMVDTGLTLITHCSLPFW